MLVTEHEISHGAVPLAVLGGADFSALSITPSNADQAPAAMRAALARFAPFDADHEFDFSDRVVLDLGDAGAARMAWPDAYAAIRSHAQRVLDHDCFSVMLGGDHSVAWPVVDAVARRSQQVGILQIDVHHDVRSLEHGPSNGTPIRGLIENNLVLSGNVAQIGIHPYANRPELHDWCELHGIHRWSIDSVVSRGPAMVVAQALNVLSNCDRIHLTVDIDVLDRSCAPGTVAALPGGLTPGQLTAVVAAACADRRVQSMDIVEFDPTRDVQSITAYNAAYVIMTALSAVARRTAA